MKREQLNEAGKRMCDMWRNLGLSESAAVDATLGRDDAELYIESAFDLSVQRYMRMGLTEAGARVAAIGRNSTESEARQLAETGRAYAVAHRAARSAGLSVNAAGKVSLQESAAVAGRGQHFRARLIAGDTLGACGYYSKKVLEASRGLFATGTQVYLDHPTVAEAYERPERSVRDLAGRLSTTAEYQGDGLYAQIEVFPHVAPVIEAMRHDIGLSIRAEGTLRQGTVNGRSVPMIESIDRVDSVDFVTRAGAGGRIV